MAKSIDPVSRFRSSYEEADPPYGLPDPCWMWQKSTYTNTIGYGQFSVNGKPVSAHRFSYREFNGPIPAGMLVLHKCDRPACVNPKHLKLGTYADNQRDKERRNRVGHHKITDDQVVEIRLQLSRGRGATEIAKQYEVSPGMVRHIQKGRSRVNPTDGRQSW